MRVIMRMAFRNLLEHRSKSLIVGILLALGVVILVVGNSFIDATAAGIRRTFTDSYTGDVFVSGVSSGGQVSLFGVQSAGGIEGTPTIPDFERIRGMLESLPEVSGVTAMATGFGMTVRDPGSAIQDVAQEDDGDPGSRFLFMFGVDARDYWNVFDSVDITSGSRLAPGQTGIIIYEKHLQKLSTRLGRTIGIGDTILVQGFGSAGMRLRELPVVGTYMQKGEGASPEQMAFVDIDSVRVMTGMTVGANENIVLGEGETSLLSVGDLDSIFGDEMIVEGTSGAGAFDEAEIVSILGDTGERERLNTADFGAWHFLLVRTGDPSLAKATIQKLNTWFAGEGIHAEAGDWQKAAGPYGQSVDVVRIVFNIAIVILAVVAIIIITNTLVISVIERTGEIGTMRAIGASKRFIRRLFAAETFVLSSVFGLAGVAIGSVVVVVIRSLRIEAGNPFLEVLFGGRYLTPILGFGTIVGSLAGIVVVGYLAHLYPVSVALRIQPVRAMQTE